MAYIGLFKLGERFRTSDLNYPDFVRKYSNEIERDQAIQDAMLIARANDVRHRQEIANDLQEAIEFDANAETTRHSPPRRNEERRWRVVEVTVLDV